MSFLWIWIALSREHLEEKSNAEKDNMKYWYETIRFVYYQYHNDESILIPLLS
jgi:hypothetical protein